MNSKRLISILLSICIMLTVASFPAMAATSGTCGDNLTWTLDDNGTLTISGTGAMTDYHSYSSVPWSSDKSSIKTVVIGNGVTSIGSYAFCNCYSLTSVNIPDSVTSIGNYAFYWCESLASVTIPDSVIFMGSYAFGTCTSLTSVTIGNSVTKIYENTFTGCDSLTSVTIPDSVTKIGAYAFAYCDFLANITIGSSVTSISSSAFCGCTSLTEINVDEDNQNYFSADGVLFNENKTTLVAYPGGKSGAYVIPDGVTEIGDRAFAYCYFITSIVVPDGVTAIGSGAFYNCSSLTSITIPDSLISVGNTAFYGCSKLADVYYGGTKVQKDAIYFDNGNSDLTDATWHVTLCYNGHTYDNDCDPDCNVCTATRDVPDHVYDSNIDTKCNVCGDIRRIDGVIEVGEKIGVICAIPADLSKGVEVYDTNGVLVVSEPVVGSDFVAFNVTAPKGSAGKIGQIIIRLKDEKRTVLASMVVAVAESDDEPTADPTAPTFVVSNGTAKVGDTFTVAVSTKNNIGIVSLKLNIGYDAEVLELISIEEGDFANTTFGAVTNNPISVLWEDVLSDNNITNGTVALLTFKVKDTASAGTTEITITYDPEDVYDYDMNNVDFAVENGTITVIEYISGDVNGDGNVNNKDYGILRQYLNNWEVNIDERAADVNRDGAVNNKDLGILRRYLNNWDVELL